MNFKEYIELSKRTDKDLGENNSLHAYIGMYNEFGELIGPIKKSLFPGKELDKSKLTDELGDVTFYLAKACRLEGFIVPLASRYIPSENILDIIYLFNQGWNTKDLERIYLCLLDFCSLYNLDFEEALEKNIAKLKVRHPQGFNIDNPKHTKEEQDAIK